MLAGMYTERALVLPPTADMIEGRAAIENYWKGVIAAGLRNLSLRSVRVDEYGGDAASEIGWFTVEAPEPRGRTGTIEGKYVVVWRKSGGGWQHDSDIWNFTEPSAEPDAATGASAAPGAGNPSPSR
jgi:ketosteroid isomerase-like protein